ncbi:MAG: S8 family serine peptidase [Verrucomicrobia bacterium]|nr:S8 family serine peptidase [Verrucomicrobiota bacterium]
MKNPRNVSFAAVSELMYRRIVNAKRAFLLSLVLALGIFPALLAPPALCAENTLAWRLKDDRVDARIDSWELNQLLEQLTTLTGWQIFVEPDTQFKVSTQFKNLPSGEALRRLLGKLNYALLPQTNAPAKLFVYRNNLTDATQLVRGKEAPQAVPDELILTLKNGSKTSAEELAKRLGGKITGRLGDVNAYRLKFADADAARAAREALQSENDVATVDENYIIPRPANPEALALSSAPPFALNPPVANDGSRVVVGLIDTGVQRLGNSLDAYVLPGLAVNGDGKSDGTTPTHGTSMAETILRGMASVPGGNGASAQILPVDVYGRGESTTMFDVASGISLAIQRGATVINLSLAGSGGSSYVEILIQNTSRNGVLYFAAAGNQPTTAANYPAAYPSVVAVTAGSAQGLASYANYGSFVDIVLPGTSIVQFGNQNWLISGTSASAAYASGLALGTIAVTGRTAKEVEASMRNQLKFSAGGK